MDIQQVLQLIEEGLTQQHIADRLGVSVNKLRYSLAKHRKQESIEPHLNETDRTDKPLGLHVDYAALEEHEHGDRLILLPGDRTSLYVYWEITERRRQLIEGFFGCGWHVLPKLLRVYDVTLQSFHGDNANRYFDVPINDYANNWFIHHVDSGAAYCIDYGTTTLDGRFITILRSNTAETPPGNPQGRRDRRLSTIEMAEDAKPEWMESFTGYSLA